MDKKKLIFNLISIIAALVLLVFVLTFAVKILNKEENDQSDNETSLIVDNQDISIVIDEQDESDNEAPFEPVLEDDSDIHTDVSIDIVHNDIQTDNEEGNVEPNNKDINYETPVPEPVVDI